MSDFKTKVDSLVLRERNQNIISNQMLLSQVTLF